MVQITHTEILVLAISALEAKIARWRPDPDQQIDELTKQIILPMHEKCETLKALYKVETGVEYT